MKAWKCHDQNKVVGRKAKPVLGGRTGSIFNTVTSVNDKEKDL